MKKDIFIDKKALKKFSGIRVLVIGDIMLDHYVGGQVTRISPEAPVPVLRKISEDFMPGGAGNVAKNLRSLGSKVTIAGVVGNDHSSQILMSLFRQSRIDVTAVLKINGRTTTTKERFVAREQHMLRVDAEDDSALENNQQKKFIRLIEKKIKKCDGVIISDYAKGLLSPIVVKSIIKLAKKSKKKIFADIKPINKDLYKGVDVLTPNLKEAFEMTGQKDVHTVGRMLVKFFKTNIIITKGENGASVFKKDGKFVDLSAKNVNVLDVSGAGDTFIAVEALSMLSGLSIEEAGFVASAAATIVVQKPGTAFINYEELESALNDHMHVEGVEIVPKLWGYEKWLENNPKYCCKLLSLNKGYSCSLHYHKIKDETFFVIKGHVRLEAGKEVVHMRTGNFIRILPGTKHRFSGIEDSLIVEVSTFHDDNDSYRIEKSRKFAL